MVLLVLTTFIFSADDATIFLEFGGMTKSCLTPETACHSLDQAVKHAKWENVTDIVIQGHAELIGEIIFDSNADKFKKTPAEDLKYIMTLKHHVLSSNTDQYGLTGLGTIVIKGTDTSEMHLEVTSDHDYFFISTSRTPGGTKKDYVLRVEQYGALSMAKRLVIQPLQLQSTTTFTKLTSQFETEPWDKKSAAIIVDKGSIIILDFVQVRDPELGVLILKDIDIEKSQIFTRQRYAMSLPSLVPKGIVCSIPDNSTSTFNIKIVDAGKQHKEDDKLVGIDQYPLDIHLSGKCAAYDSDDTTQKFPLNNTDMTNISKAAFVFPQVSLSRSDLKLATQTGEQSNDLGIYLLADLSSLTASLGIAALRRLKVSIAPRYHTEDTDDKLIRWDEMTCQVTRAVQWQLFLEQITNIELSIQRTLHHSPPQSTHQHNHFGQERQARQQTPQHLHFNRSLLTSHHTGPEPSISDVAKEAAPLCLVKNQNQSNRRNQSLCQPQRSPTELPALTLPVDKPPIMFKPRAAVAQAPLVERVEPINLIKGSAQRSEEGENGHRSEPVNILKTTHYTPEIRPKNDDEENEKSSGPVSETPTPTPFSTMTPTPTPNASQTPNETLMKNPFANLSTPYESLVRILAARRPTRNEVVPKWYESKTKTEPMKYSYLSFLSFAGRNTQAPTEDFFPETLPQSARHT
ncbi:hypothetical protein BLNAU_16688 [Blattamonas nauphoetae]|uniref:Uncharacterized protein n=1 Tax=Blattamonas nauphoetae TaxID=2049346 RepID=A0ABQ9XCG2_9EUKA|nr:hypothetical protein BLNAU_16688 [Blattamonas nauphoetae]